MVEAGHSLEVVLDVDVSSGGRRALYQDILTHLAVPINQN